ncbi:MAG TPA: sterol desaturase family protein [Kofleriaceae bacterium]
MTTDALAQLALGWLAFVAWSLVAFTLLERVRPRHHAHPGARRIALAAALLVVDAGLAQLVFHVADLHGGRIVLTFVAAELLHYGLHVAMHRFPLLWRFHRLHHADAPLNWTTAWFVHPVDAVLIATAGVAAAVLAGGGAAAAAWFVVGRRVWTVVLHANLTWPASRLDGLVATPPFHARHHREDLPAANFAGTLSILDRIFGTYRAGPGPGMTSGRDLWRISR